MRSVVIVFVVMVVNGAVVVYVVVECGYLICFMLLLKDVHFLKIVTKYSC